MSFEQIQFPNIEKRERDYVKEVAKNLITQTEIRQESIGEGRTANVLLSDNEDSICLKSVFNKNEALNNVHLEMKFLEELENAGIRVPSPICAISTSENDYLLMETIDGISLDDLLIRNKVDLLPRDFDIIKIRAFFKELKEMIAKMNSLNIYHMDLHFGNIMIDKNCKPVIIDTGDAIKTNSSSENPFIKTNSKGGQNRLPTDEDNIHKAFIATQNYLKSIGYFEQFKLKE